MKKKYDENVWEKLFFELFGPTFLAFLAAGIILGISFTILFAFVFL